jgi:replication-associated recombination protein RarA
MDEIEQEDHLPLHKDNQTELLAAKYRPKSLEQLAVNPSKIKELEIYLKSTLQSSKPKLLFITGPPGSGRTATIELLARHLNFVNCQLTVRKSSNGKIH